MSELRQDLVSGDWIIIAPERGGRPYDIIPPKSIRLKSSQKNCPFDNLKKSGNWPPILTYPNEKNWKVAIIPNKYPALKHEENSCAARFNLGPYRLTDGIGYHDLIITRDHNTNFAHLKLKEGVRVFRILQERYRMLAADKCLLYTSIFFNWGPTAGASIYHPHFQVLTLPIVPPDIESSLLGSARYFKNNKRCVHCVMLKWERKTKKRVITENSSAVAIAPFVSREPFEIRIFPKKHMSRLEEAPTEDLRDIVAVLQSSLRKIESRLNDPDYNFFIHTAPLRDHGLYKHYHWHIEIIPKISITAGFELSTGVDINVVDPDKAAAILR